MRYFLEFNEDPDVVHINLDLKVVDFTVSSDKFWGDPEEEGWATTEPPKLLKQIFDFDGVCRVSFSPYLITVEKGTIHKWSDVIGGVLTFASFALEKDPLNTPIVEDRPPVRFYTDSSGCTKTKPYSMKKADGVIKPRKPRKKKVPTEKKE